MSNGPCRLALVLPCFNEEIILDSSVTQLLALLATLDTSGKIAPGSLIYLVDDGSSDSTWQRIRALHESHPDRVYGLKLAHNVGHQGAILAGMLSVRARVDCMITLDVDLQDDLAVVGEMIDRFREGHQIVYGVRKLRRVDTFVKRTTALGFYRFMRLMGVDVVHNHADFRLISRRVADELAGFREVNLFLRGIFPLMGFRSTTVTYDRRERLGGEPKYSYYRMLSLAWDGITSFSSLPLRLILLLGLITFLGSVGLIGWATAYAMAGKTVPGWASTVISVYVFAGAQLISIGLIGEYLAKIYREVKSRPRFIKEEELP